MKRVLDEVMRFLFGSVPSLSNWDVLVDDVVMGRIGEPVYWDSGYHYYKFSPATGFTQISDLVDQVKLAVESGDDAAEDDAYQAMSKIQFVLKSPQGECLRKGDFDLYMFQEDEVRIRLLESGQRGSKPGKSEPNIRDNS